MRNASSKLDASHRRLQRFWLVAMDGSNFELPDEPENIDQFGYPGSRTGQAWYPQAQCAVLIECITHAIFAANIDSYRASEWSVCEPLLKRMGM